MVALYLSMDSDANQILSAFLIQLTKPAVKLEDSIRQSFLVMTFILSASGGSDLARTLTIVVDGLVRNSLAKYAEQFHVLFLYRERVASTGGYAII